MSAVEPVRKSIKSVVHYVAQRLHKLSRGRITPNQVTLVGFAAHIPIAVLIGSGHYHWAAALFLAIFGLFDTLDGELARLQGRASHVGMFLDSATDRLKEVLIYCGIMASLAPTANRALLVVTVAVLGASMCISYLNAWGEAILSQIPRHLARHKLNKSFRSGLMGFDLRMLVLILGLLIDKLEVTMYVMLVLAMITILQRFWDIAARLRNVQG